MSFKGSVRVRRGLVADLPASAPLGELLIATDTGELFYGTGTGVKRSPNRVMRAYTVSVPGSGTFGWPEEWASPPVVTLTAVSEAGSRPNVAELASDPTTTTVSIRAWRVGNGLAVNTQRTMTVHIHAYGELV